MDAISKELETWNLTFLLVLATLINLMLRKYFSVLVHIHKLNVIFKFFNVENDKTATLTKLLNVTCLNSTCKFDGIPVEEAKSTTFDHTRTINSFKMANLGVLLCRPVLLYLIKIVFKIANKNLMRIQ